MTIVSRCIYLLTGVAALYMVLAPTLSGVRNAQPLWVQVGFWCAGLFLLSGASGNFVLGNRLAAVGSAVVIALYLCLALLPVAARLGLYRIESRLVAVREFPRWRYTFDRPVLVLLLILSLMSLLFAVQFIINQRKELSAE